MVSPVLWWKAWLLGPCQLTLMFLLFLGCSLVPGASVAVANRTIFTVGRKYLPCNRWSNPKYLSEGCRFYVVADT